MKWKEIALFQVLFAGIILATFLYAAQFSVCEGFYGGFCVMGWVMYGIVGAVLLELVLSFFLIREQRLLFIFITFLLNAAVFSIMLFVSVILASHNENRAMQDAYSDCLKNEIGIDPNNLQNYCDTYKPR